MKSLDELKETLKVEELTDDNIESIVGGDKALSEYTEEMIAFIQTLIYLTPTALTQLKQTAFFNVYAIYFRCSSFKTSPDLFDEFIDVCKKYGNIDYKGCYVLK